MKNNQFTTDSPEKPKRKKDERQKEPNMDAETVFIEKPITVGARRTTRVYAMRKGEAEIEKLLPSEMRGAQEDIEFCVRYVSGELSKCTNLSAYGIVSGGAYETLEDKAKFLMPKYDKWKKWLAQRDSRALKIVLSVTINGDSLRRAGEGCYLSVKEIGNLLLYGLNEYCIISGRGDVLGQFKEAPGYSHVYIIGAPSGEGALKIGIAEKPKARLQGLQIGNPAPLSILFLMRGKHFDIRRLETELHRHFKSRRAGGEWFNVPLEEIKDAARLMYSRGVEIDVLTEIY